MAFTCFLLAFKKDLLEVGEMAQPLKAQAPNQKDEKVLLVLETSK